MARGKSKNLSNGNQDNLEASETSSPTTASSGFSNSPEKQDMDLKSYFRIMMGVLKKHMNCLTPLNNYRRTHINK